MLGGVIKRVRESRIEFGSVSGPGVGARSVTINWDILILLGYFRGDKFAGGRVCSVPPKFGFGRVGGIGVYVSAEW